MSETPHNDIERDAELTAIYRAAAHDAPPEALDEAIRAAARRAVGARPRPAAFSFGQAWRVPLSIAAVMVLSVSIVVLMREEAPELTAPPHAGVPDAKRKAAAGADEEAAATSPGFVPDLQRSKNIGLKPPPAASPPAVGMRQPGSAEPGVQAGKENVAGRLESDTAVASSAPARRRDASASSVEQRDMKVAASAEQPRQAAKVDAPQEAPQSPAAAPPRVAAVRAAPAPAAIAPAPAGGSVAGVVAEKKTQIQQEAATAGRVEPESQLREQPARAPVLAKQAADAAPPVMPAAKPAVAQAKPAPRAAGDMGKLENRVDLPPEKWLERIAELRKQGKFEEAKASLAGFRKRYPDYRLPDSLRDWAGQ